MEWQALVNVDDENVRKELLSFLEEKHEAHVYRFMRHFYLTLFPHPDKFCLFMDDVAEWLGYTWKCNLKTIIKKHLVLDQEYKIEVEQKSSHNEIIKLTVDGFKKLGMCCDTPQGRDIRMYYIDLEKAIMEYVMHHAYLRKLEELKALEETKNAEIYALRKYNEEMAQELEVMRNKGATAYIYIFDTDPREKTHGEDKHLKIGIARDTIKRSKPYRQIAPYGRMVYSVEISNDHAPIVEKWMHLLLERFQTRGENYCMNIELAKMILKRVTNTLKVCNELPDNELQTVIAKMIDNDNKLLSNDELTIYVAHKTVETQTNHVEVHEVASTALIQKSPLHEKFEEFINECCVLGDEHEVSSTAIMGLYRIWAKEASKDMYHAMVDYLKTRFKPVRLQVQGDAEGLLNGFQGVNIIQPEIKMSADPSDAERFVFQECVFVPDGKVLKTSLYKNLEEWCSNVKRTVSPYELKQYLSMCEYVLPAIVWTTDGNGVGYYGLTLKSNEKVKRKNSFFAKHIEKRDKNGVVMKSWPSISKAASDEGIVACRLSRMIKSGKATPEGWVYVPVTAT